MANLLSYALCTLADVKESLNISSGDTSKDNLIKRKINQATLAIENYCGRHFKETTYTQELYDAGQIDELVLRQRPVTATTTFALEVRDTGLNSDNWTAADSQLYFTDNSSGVIRLLFNSIGRWGRYRVTYSAGYAPNAVWPDGLPEDLREACVSLAGWYVNEADSTSAGVAEKQEGQRRIRYDNQSTDFSSVMRQLGIDQIINSYSNYPLLADR